MTSYQRLKAKCEKLQSQVDLFKDALTISTKIERGEEFHPEAKITGFSYHYFVEKMNREIDYEARRKLCEWVATNLDKEYVMELLELKERLEKCGTT